MTLRAGRAHLADRLGAAAVEGRNPDPHANAAFWSRAELCDLLVEARDAVLTCPRTPDCTTCFTLEREEAE